MDSISPAIFMIILVDPKLSSPINFAMMIVYDLFILYIIKTTSCDRQGIAISKCISNSDVGSCPF